ncbi:MAG: hypothetical protein NTX45_02935 [Proteobacteria bacterium]|nr:hypothetical protein [Pseudomonadota bacterium]
MLQRNTILNFNFKVLATAAILSVSTVTQAKVVWSENFDSATAGQSVTAPPLNWSVVPGYGDVKVGASPHPGWQGNAIIGTLATSPAGGAWAKTNLPTTPTTGIVSVKFDAWAFANYLDGGEIYLNTNTGGHFTISAWNNYGGLVNEWDMGYFNGSSYSGRWFSPSNFMRDQTVHVSFNLDYANQKFWGVFDNGSSIVTTPFMSFTGTPALTSLGIWEDKRWGSKGTDFDNFTISSVPEPDEWAMMLLGAGMVAFQVKRKQKQL